MKGGWTTTASVDCGSGRPANGTPREALPQCAATAPPKTSRGTASYCMARPAQTESTPVCESFASGPQNARHPTDVVDAHVSLLYSTATDASESQQRDSKSRGPIFPVHVRFKRRGVPSAAWDSGRWGSGGCRCKQVRTSARLRLGCASRSDLPRFARLWRRSCWEIGYSNRTVNQEVAGSSPARGANYSAYFDCLTNSRSRRDATHGATPIPWPWRVRHSRAAVFRSGGTLRAVEIMLGR